jgi:chromate reductase, NAD(P)H dehydrogenase (quinone)
MPVHSQGEIARIEIAAIAGSLRSGSWARTMLRAMAEQRPSNVEITIWNGLDQVPPFNEDLESGPAPTAVADMRQVIQRSDALVIATPEYNQSIPGVLKNALDWASRPYGQSVLTHKPVAVVGTSPLPTGGASALTDVTKVVSLLGAEVIEAELAVGQVHTRIDVESHFLDLELATRVAKLLDKIVACVAARALALSDA